MQVVHEIVATASIRKYLGIVGIISFSFVNLYINTLQHIMFITYYKPINNSSLAKNLADNHLNKIKNISFV